MPSRTMRAKRRKNQSRQQGAKPGAITQYASDAWSLAQRTASGLNEIRKLINIETKFLDVSSSLTYGTTAGVVTPITQVAQGLTSTTRVGDSIKLQHIEVRGSVHSTVTTASSVFRVIMFRDLDGYGTAPVGSDVLELTGSSQAVYSPHRYNTRNRFSILFDEIFAQSNGAEQGNSNDVFYYSSAHAGHVLYLGATAAAASNGKGSVYMLTVADAASSTAAAFYSRILFTDD